MKPDLCGALTSNPGPPCKGIVGKNQLKVWIEIQTLQVQDLRQVKIERGGAEQNKAYEMEGLLRPRATWLYLWE